MGSIEKYRQYFTKEYLMGPNSFRLLDELIRKKPSDARFHRTLDLGCGFALTSLFVADETDADYVYARNRKLPEDPGQPSGGSGHPDPRRRHGYAICP